MEDVTVEYTVAEPKFDLSLSDLQFSLTTDGTAVSSQVVNIDNNFGDDFDWIIINDIDWLDVVNASGDTTTNQSATFQVNQNAGSLSAGNYSDIIVIQDGDEQIIVPVSLHIDLPTINSVFPAVGSANTPQSVTIMGSGFENSVTQLNLGSYEINDYTVVDDNKIVAQLPSMLAGEYSIELSDALPIALAGSSYQIVDTPVFSNHSIQIGNSFASRQSITFDAKRNCLYNFDWLGLNKICYVENADLSDENSWQEVYLDGNTSYQYMTITPDFEHLVLFNSWEFAIVDLNTFTIKEVYQNDDFYGVERIVFYSNNRAFLIGTHEIYGLDIHTGLTEDHEYSQTFIDIGLTNAAGTNGSGIIDISPDLASIYFYKEAESWDYLYGDRANFTFTHKFDIHSLTVEEVSYNDNLFVTGESVYEIGTSTYFNAYAPTGKSSTIYNPGSDLSFPTQVDIFDSSNNTLTLMNSVDVSHIDHDSYGYYFWTNYDGSLLFFTSDSRTYVVNVN